jgi:hypothetical protein
MESTKYGKVRHMLEGLKDSGRLLEIANTAAEINAAVALLEAVDVDEASESLKATVDNLGRELGKGYQGISRTSTADIRQLRSLVESLGSLGVFHEQISVLQELHGIKPQEAEAARKWTKLKAENLPAKIETFGKIVRVLKSIDALRLAAEKVLKGHPA